MHDSQIQKAPLHTQTGNLKSSQSLPESYRQSSVERRSTGAPTAPAEGAAGETGATDTGVVPSGATPSSRQPKPECAHERTRDPTRTEGQLRLVAALLLSRELSNSYAYAYTSKLMSTLTCHPHNHCTQRQHKRRRYHALHLHRITVQVTAAG